MLNSLQIHSALDLKYSEIPYDAVYTEKYDTYNFNTREECMMQAHKAQKIAFTISEMPAGLECVIIADITGGFQAKASANLETYLIDTRAIEQCVNSDTVLEFLDQPEKAGTPFQASMNALSDYCSGVIKNGGNGSCVNTAKESTSVCDAGKKFIGGSCCWFQVNKDGKEECCPPAASDERCGCADSFIFVEAFKKCIAVIKILLHNIVDSYCRGPIQKQHVPEPLCQILDRKSVV
uniref:Thyroglobulin type-1 domain-containing protein n=1 Tax=Steinernema glaseri TaxID=37863 RepID=A0A1I7ZQL6_9BILA